MSTKKKAEAKPEGAAPSEKPRRVRGRARAEIAGKVIEGPASGKPAVLTPGTKLVREYKGKKIVVTCMEGGRFEYDGRFYTSLSKLACEITKSHLSGPRWFGLVRPGGRKPGRAKGKK